MQRLGFGPNRIAPQKRCNVASLALADSAGGLGWWADGVLFQSIDVIVAALMFPTYLNTENLTALLTLTALEIVLGMDNLVFLSILTNKLPHAQRASARVVGLSLAMGARIGLLLAISWVMGLTSDLFSFLGRGISGRDLILLTGGMFLVAKSTHEIHEKLTTLGETAALSSAKEASFGATILQIVLIDMVFSLDSVITAVGMAQALWVMIAAVIVAVILMMVFSGKISDFIEKYPTMKVLALAFLILIGVMLLAEAMDQHFERGYVYFAMVFALVVEFINIRMRKAEHQSRKSPQDLTKSV
jgi:predicted tellurium resistance membrane protein TerC